MEYTGGSLRCLEVCMDADKIRLGETGFEELIDWLRESGQPQTLDTLTYQYMLILRNKVLDEPEVEE
jgi:hypothetical protein